MAIRYSPERAFLTIHALLIDRDRADWRWGVLGVMAVCILLLQRDVVGKDLAIVILSYKVDTRAAMLPRVLSIALPSLNARLRAKRLDRAFNSRASNAGPLAT